MSDLSAIQREINQGASREHISGLIGGLSCDELLELDRRLDYEGMLFSRVDFRTPGARHALVEVIAGGFDHLMAEDLLLAAAGNETFDTDAWLELAKVCFEGYVNTSGGVHFFPEGIGALLGHSAADWARLAHEGRWNNITHSTLSVAWSVFMISPKGGAVFLEEVAKTFPAKDFVLEVLEPWTVLVNYWPWHVSDVDAIMREYVKVTGCVTGLLMLLYEDTPRLLEATSDATFAFLMAAPQEESEHRARWLALLGQRAREKRTETVLTKARSVG